MSVWLRPYIKTYPKFGGALSELTQFFKLQVREQEGKPPPPISIGRLADDDAPVLGGGASRDAGASAESDQWEGKCPPGDA